MTVAPVDPVAQLSSAPGAMVARPTRRRLALMAGLGVVLALVLYYPVGAWRAHIIDDDPNFAPADMQAAPSKAVALAAAVIRREIDIHGWVPNKPFFLPVAILDDMPSFQKGIATMVGRFAIEMDEQIGRLPKPDGTAAGSDPDLERATILMAYPPTIWMIDPTMPWARVLSTEKQYRNAARAFKSYNQRLAAGTAGFARSNDALQAFALGFANELDDTAASLEAPIIQANGWFSRSAGRAYYTGKGRAYAALLLLKALGEDYRSVLADRHLTEGWRAMLMSVAAAALPRPWVVLDGDAASTLVPNHLAFQGYHLQRGASQLNELAEALR